MLVAAFKAAAARDCALTVIRAARLAVPDRPTARVRRTSSKR